MTRAGSGILKRLAIHRNKLPLETIVPKPEHRDTPRRSPRFAVGVHCLNFRPRGSTGTDDELPDSAIGIGTAVRVLRREALVHMIVAVDHEVHVELVERAPDVAHVRVVAISP